MISEKTKDLDPKSSNGVWEMALFTYLMKSWSRETGYSFEYQVEKGPMYVLCNVG